MFDSKVTLLWEKGGPLAVVWIAANLGKTDRFRVKLTRREYCRTNVIDACNTILEPDMQLSLRLISHLLLGIVRIHYKQAHYALQELEDLKHRFENMSKSCPIDICTKMKCNSAITLPEPSFDTGFTSMVDLSLSEIDVQTGYLTLDIDAMLLNAGPPKSPEPRTGSMKGTPPPSLYLADPKDISIDEEAVEQGCDLLEDSLRDSMYFGDEDPKLIHDMEKHVNDDQYSHDAEDKSVLMSNGDVDDVDQVLIYNENSGSFEYNSIGGMDLSSSISESGNDNRRPELALQTPHTPEAQKFECPSLNCSVNKRSTTNNLSLKLSPINLEDIRLPRKANRSRRPKRLFDETTQISSYNMRQSLDNSELKSRTSILRREMMVKGNELLTEPFTRKERNHVLESQYKTMMTTFKQVTKTYSPIATSAKLPTSTPRRNINNSSSIEHSGEIEELRRHSNSELEILRKAHGEEISYEDVLRNASAISGDSIRSSQSFQVSTAMRMKSEIGGATRPELPLAMGGLSPIVDVNEEIDISAGSYALPELDDSEDIMASSFYGHNSKQVSSPFIESKTSAYQRHIVSAMGRQTEIPFSELLPSGSTRKTAGIAFFHVLSILNKSDILSVEQKDAYGPIILRRGLSF